MYSKIAFSNVKKSIRDYTIYFLTLTFGICLFYMFNSIQSQQAVLKINESQRSMMELLSSMINGISVFIAVILGFLIIYANQFLMKRRHKEMGIYLILGMEKGQVSKILIIETMFIGIFALIVGLAAGVFLSQGLAVLTAKMFSVQMKEFGFVFSTDAFFQTILYFAIIFIIVMIFNGISISKYKLIDLINSAKKNQKLKVNHLWFSVVMFIISALCIGWAYHLIIENGMLEADLNFWMSILLGIAGTFLFFLSLSGFLLRLAKSNKAFYYRGLHMFVLRQINSKITTAFVSMTMLCLMLFLAISAFATGTGMAATVKSDLKDVTKFDYGFYDYETKQEETKNPDYLTQQLKKDGIDLIKDAKDIVPVMLFSDTSDMTKSKYTMEEFMKGREELADFPKTQMKELYKVPISFVRLSDYNKFRKVTGKKPLTLKDHQYALSCNYSNLIEMMQQAVKDRQKLHFGKETFDLKYQLLEDTYFISTGKYDAGTVIVNDVWIEKLGLHPITTYVSINWKSNGAKVSKQMDEQLEKTYGLEKQKPFTTSISRENVYVSNTGLSTMVTYVAVYIGLVFLITCAAVLALQQLSENADNIEKYQLLDKIGVPKTMVYGSIKAQIIIYFLIPLSLALVHSYVGITTASSLISTLGHMDITSAVMKSLITVLIIYGGYMLATYFGSKSMLKGK